MDSELTVAVADPTRIKILDTLAGQTKCHIQTVLASPGEMDPFIKSYYESEFASFLYRFVPTPLTLRDRPDILNTCP